MQIIFLFKLFYSSAYIFTQGLYNESLLHQLIIKNAYTCIFFSEIHIVLHYKYILLKNQRTDSLGYKIHMMCNETHEEQIQYSYAAT